MQFANTLASRVHCDIDSYYTHLRYKFGDARVVAAEEQALKDQLVSDAYDMQASAGPSTTAYQKQIDEVKQSHQRRVAKKIRVARAR